MPENFLLGIQHNLCLMNCSQPERSGGSGRWGYLSLRHSLDCDTATSASNISIVIILILYS